MHVTPGLSMVLGWAWAVERPCGRWVGTRGATRWGWRRRLEGAACPAGYDGAVAAKPATISANTLRSGQLVGRCTRMRAACSMMRAPILISRRRSVVNSQRACGLEAGSLDLSACMIQ